MEVGCESESIRVLTENVSGGLGEKRLVVVGTSASSSAELRPSAVGSDQISALNPASGIFGPDNKLRDASTKNALTDNTLSKVVPGQAAIRQSTKHSLFGPRRARLCPLTVDQVITHPHPQNLDLLMTPAFQTIGYETRQ